ncbi:transcription antitermination factor NusB [Simiduia agarivorans]|uniref:Transcription antitermination protein NusB n=1 Tax=Simiduia agarivorans (strain DSM 21679 / JCM 13881 / BCRC 17597 / SA1) TaxID=1117647 RepID=K4KM67_SIMAS|nr:transcription antitermination factor NusB [Simiduia agarivorans]AFU99153.1 transcription antitermination protein NusB [Simiduia agarivorans SA1 = DSM 21679]
MNVSASARRQARHYAMQALYQWQMAGSSLNAIEAEFRTDYDMAKVDLAYFQELLHQVPAQLDALEAAYAPHLQGRNQDELDPITQSLLRLSTYELKNRIDVPYKVVINEAVALAKKFGATDAHKFINAVLDQTAAQLRAVEVQAERGRN